MTNPTPPDEFELQRRRVAKATGVPLDRVSFDAPPDAHPLAPYGDNGVEAAIVSLTQALTASFRERINERFMEDEIDEPLEVVEQMVDEELAGLSRHLDQRITEEVIPGLVTLARERQALRASDAES